MLSYRDNTINQVRNHFVDLLLREQFVVDKTGVKMLEICGAAFVADQETIFGQVNHDYVNREIAWYESQSLCVDDIPPPIPAIWKQVASKTGHRINSNYGHLIWSWENGEQYTHVLNELVKNPFSRRAVMIYTRPQIWEQYDFDGMSDFICTNAVQYFIRDGFLDVVVQMRSNDAWAGYRNDLAWQRHVQAKLRDDLNRARVSQGLEEIELGTIFWNAGSLHFYERQFYLVHNYYKTGEINVSKETYRDRFPDSPWCQG